MKYCTATSFGTQKAVPLEYKSGKTRIVRNGYLSSQIEKVLPIDLYSTYDCSIRGRVSALPTPKQKSAHLCAAISSFPPEKHLACAPRGQRKSGRNAPVSFGKFVFGAGRENRTPISSLENLHTNRCTIPASAWWLSFLSC